MKTVMQINPEILEREKIVVWKNGVNTQKIMCELFQENIRMDFFCGDVVDVSDILGKKVISVDELVRLPSYALLVSAKEYDEILEKYREQGLKEENMFAWISPEAEFIYI